ncbi:MAG: hypothetical protein HeimAB125_14460 [Candidatus Heimdallarchaeota archaeon AB_125]|nr:MAG: hypothetical protein HeimAB125_14460 [Candidatus Heimdallarchaeota archaeon AB_125]
MRAVFLAAIIPKTGPEVIVLYPEDTLSKDEIEELSLICMPMGSTEGDFASIVFNGYQVAGYLTSTPPIDENLDPRDTIVSIGFLLDTYTDPTPYRNLLMDFVIKCSTNESFTLPTLERIIPEFLELKDYKNIIISLNDVMSCELSLEN